MAQTVLVTGANGFLGKHLCAHLSAIDAYKVIRVGQTKIQGIDAAVDILHKSQIDSALEVYQPDVVVHLAAISSIVHGDRSEIYQTNVLGSLNIMEAIADAEHRPSKIVALSSAAIYGNQPTDVLHEDLVPAPANDYGISKLAMEHLMLQWKHVVDVVALRLFNCTGLGQSDHFVIPKIVKHFQRGAKEISLGRTDTVREYNDVRYVAGVIESLLSQNTGTKTVNVCSERGYALDEVISILREETGHDIRVINDERFFRENELEKLVGSTALLSECVPVLPAKSIKDTLLWMLRG